MIELVEQLQNTTKRNKKLEILEQHKHDDLVKLLIFYTYNPNYNYFIKKIWEPEKVGNYTLFDKFSETITILDYLRKRYYTGHTALKIVKEFMEILNKDSQKLFKLILTKDLKCGINLKTINKIWPFLLPESDFQLAEQYNPEKDYNVKYWYYSPKLDGIRCKIHRDIMLPLGRKGKELKNTTLIMEACKHIFDNTDIDFLDGELYIPGYNFSQIISIVSKHKFRNTQQEKDFIVNEMPKLQFWLFACDGADINNTRDMINRLNNLNSLIKLKELFPIKIVPQELIKNDYNTIISKMKQVVNQGYEGIMLRHPQIHYEFKRSNSLLKVKPIFEADLKVTDIETGNMTMYQDDKLIQIETITAIYVEGYAEDSKRKEYIQTKVGSGFTFEDRKEIYENPDKYIGKIAEIEFQELTKNKSNKSKWSLRFPVFKRWRFDKS